ncbi:MAG: hypothetical protein JO097_14870 [Acidobacteriaceae bacterium]|nr:hypothetical protein [Acidobacteriaceae bacterium]
MAWNPIHLMLLGIGVLLASGLPLCAQTKVIVIDGKARGRTFEGIGAVSAGASSRLLPDYPEPYRSQILDYLFKPHYGASLQHLKVEIGADVNSTDGSEPSHMRTRQDHDYQRGYEWWLMEEARRRSPKIMLDSLPWGAPGWIGNGNFYSPDMAEYVADFIAGARNVHHLGVKFTGVWNEKANTDLAYVKLLHRTLQSRKLDVKVVCCDQYPSEGQWSIVDAVTRDTELSEAVYAVTVHYPRKNGKVTTPDLAKHLRQPLWSSEDQPESSSNVILSRDWSVGGRSLAKLYNRNYLEGAFTKTEIWSPITSYYDMLAAPNSGLMYANTPWSGFYRVQGAIWATAHTTQFAEPGWQYMDSSSGYLPEAGTYVALRSPNARDWSIVLETIDRKTPLPLTFQVKGSLSTGTVHMWETNAKRTFEHVSDIKPQDGRFSFTFDPDSLYSLTTTTGQAKGTAQPPPDKPFPMPYSDNFESTAVGHAPKFLSDQDGAFEAQPCKNRQGRCLEQVITLKPIPWSPLPDPWTLAGDASWTDYNVAIDALLTGPGAVTLIGRVDSADVFRDKKAVWPSGYLFSVEADGNWKLISSKYKSDPKTIASGLVAFDRNQWHHLELRFQGTHIAAIFDHGGLAAVSDASHAHGMFGLGTGWNRAQFDNLSVTK